MKVAKWGNSLAVRLPRTLVDQLSLKDGDDLEVVAAHERRLEVARNGRRDDIIACLRKLSAPLPPGFTFDRDEANER